MTRCKQGILNTNIGSPNKITQEDVFDDGWDVGYSFLMIDAKMLSITFKMIELKHLHEFANR